MSLEDRHKLELEIVGDIYDAALDSALWPKVLTRICELNEANTAVITALDTLNPDYNLFITHNFDQERLLAAYRSDGMDVMEMELHGKHQIAKGIGSTALSSEIFGSQEKYIEKAGVFFERCSRPFNVYWLAGVLLDYNEFRWSALGVHRPEDWPPLTKENTDCLGRLGLHIRRSLHIHRQLTEARQQNAALYRMLDGLSSGVILLNGEGQVRYANREAERQLAGHGALGLNRLKQLRASQPKDDTELQALIRSAMAVGLRRCVDDRIGGVLGLRNDQGESLMLTITPLSEWAGFSELQRDHVAAAVFLSRPDQRQTLSRRLLKQSYGLTERECDICEAFVNQASLDEVAVACGISVETVRHYLKLIFDKTGQHSQTELMRLLMGLRTVFEHMT